MILRRNVFEQAGSVGLGAAATMHMASGSCGAAQDAIAGRTKVYAATGKSFDPFTVRGAQRGRTGTGEAQG
jgi:hypothetical protein